MISSQIDTAWVDAYLIKLLVPRFFSMWKHLSLQENLSLLFENSAWIEAFLHVLTLWFTNAQTPATKSLGIQVTEKQQQQQQQNQRQNQRQDTSSQSNTFHNNATIGVPRKRLQYLILCSVVLPTIHQKMISWYEHQEVTNSNDSTARREQISSLHQHQQQLALERRKKIVRIMLNVVQRTVPILRLMTLLSCWSGKSSTPTLALRLAGLSFATSKRYSPPLYVTYAHRRWLHEELLRTMRTVSPYTQSQTFIKLNSWLAAPFQRFLERQRARNNPLYQKRCPLCQTDSIVIPYVTDCCGHRYCYSCLSSAIMHDPSFRCVTCNKTVKSSYPLDLSDTEIVKN